jgi:hypothetical protein
MKRLVVIAVALIAIDSTYAQPLVDPMRPPAGMLATSTGAGTTSVRYAVVDGRAVAPGDQVRGMRVVRIAESSVTLRDATGKNLEVDLLPGIGKKFSASAAQPERTATPVRESK